MNDRYYVQLLHDSVDVLRPLLEFALQGNILSESDRFRHIELDKDCAAFWDNGRCALCTCVCNTVVLIKDSDTYDDVVRIHNWVVHKAVCKHMQYVISCSSALYLYHLCTIAWIIFTEDVCAQSLRIAYL